MYKDKTWCDHADCLVFNECDRAWTDEVQKEKMKHEDWMPVCFYAERPMCHQHYPKPKTESQIQAEMWRESEK